MRIILTFKCDPPSMELGFNTLPNRNVDCINIRREPQYYYVLIITLLSAKKERKSLVMKLVSKFNYPVKNKNKSKLFVMKEEWVRNPGNDKGEEDGVRGLMV